MTKFNTSLIHLNTSVISLNTSLISLDYERFLHVQSIGYMNYLDKYYVYFECDSK